MPSKRPPEVGDLPPPRLRERVLTAITALDKGECRRVREPLPFFADVA
jgi:hypothetical protein